MAAAPAIVRFVGGEVADALAASRRMYEITVGEHPMYSIPVLDFRGSPTGIDVTKVVRTEILPQINTGMAGRVAGGRRPGRRRPGHPAGRDLPQGAGRAGRAGADLSRPYSSSGSSGTIGAVVSSGSA